MNNPPILTISKYETTKFKGKENQIIEKSKEFRPTIGIGASRRGARIRRGQIERVGIELIHSGRGENCSDSSSVRFREFAEGEDFQQTLRRQCFVQTTSHRTWSETRRGVGYGVIPIFIRLRCVHLFNTPSYFL